MGNEKGHGHLLKITKVGVLKDGEIVKYHKPIHELVHDPVQVAFGKYLQKKKDNKEYKFEVNLFKIDIENKKLIEIKIPKIEIKE